MSLEVRVEPIGEEHLEAHIQLSRAEYGDSAAVSQADHLRWKFIENPDGRSVGVHLYKDGELIARMVALPRLFLFHGKTYKAAHIVDFLVHPRERGMGPLLQLVVGLKNLSGFDFLLIMAANQAGAAVWEKFVKMKGYFDLDVAVAPVRPAALLQSAGKLRSGAFAPIVDWPAHRVVRAAFWLAGSNGGMEVDTEWPDDEELDRMLSVEWKDCIVGLRSAKYLNWRYRRSPVFQYKAVFLREKGELRGYLVTRRAVYDGIDCFFVVDAFGHPGIASKSWRGAFASEFAALRGLHPEMAMIFGNMSCGSLAGLKYLPFLSVPSRFLPRKTTVYADWIRSPGFEIRRDNFYVALGDSDVI